MPKHLNNQSSSVSLTVAAMGVVYGDIGTSPLYALRECFHESHGLSVTPGNVLGILSMIVWSLVLVVTVKYLLFVMKADNEGEGGMLALMALNPVDLARVLVLLQLDVAALLGYTGAVFARAFAGPTGAAVAALVLTLWVAAPLALAARTFRRKDF